MFQSQPCTFYIISNFDSGCFLLTVVEDNLRSTFFDHLVQIALLCALCKSSFVTFRYDRQSEAFCALSLARCLSRTITSLTTIYAKRSGVRSVYADIGTIFDTSATSYRKVVDVINKRSSFSLLFELIVSNQIK